MTDETEPVTGLQVFTCINRLHPTRSCYALVEDADEPRRLHREWHASLVAKEEGQRKAIKDRDDEIARLHDAIAQHEKTAAEALRVAEGFRTEMQRVETPAPAQPLTINRDGYSDDELQDDPDEPDDDLTLRLATQPHESTNVKTATTAPQSDEIDTYDPEGHRYFPEAADDENDDLITTNRWAR